MQMFLLEVIYMQPDNPTRVAEFFKNFFKDNQELRHLFHVVVDDGNYQAE